MSAIAGPLKNGDEDSYALQRRQASQRMAVSIPTYPRLPCGLIYMNWRGGTAPFTLVGRWHLESDRLGKDPEQGRRWPIAVGVAERSYNWTGQSHLFKTSLLAPQSVYAVWRRRNVFARSWSLTLFFSHLLVSVPVGSFVSIDVIDSSSDTLRSSATQTFNVDTPEEKGYDSDWCLQHDPFPMAAPIGLDKVSPPPIVAFQSNTSTFTTVRPPSSPSRTTAPGLSAGGAVDQKELAMLIGLAIAAGITAIGIFVTLCLNMRMKKRLWTMKQDQLALVKTIGPRFTPGGGDLVKSITLRDRLSRAFSMASTPRNEWMIGVSSNPGHAPKLFPDPSKPSKSWLDMAPHERQTPGPLSPLFNIHPPVLQPELSHRHEAVHSPEWSSRATRAPSEPVQMLSERNLVLAARQAARISTDRLHGSEIGGKEVDSPLFF